MAVPNEWNIYCNEIAMILAGNKGILLVINHTYHSLSLECVALLSETCELLDLHRILGKQIISIHLFGRATSSRGDPPSKLLVGCAACFLKSYPTSEDNVRFSRPYFKADPKLGILLHRKSHAQTETISDQNIPVHK